MAVPSLAVTSIDDYLATSFHPDCDFVDGQIEERNLGEYDHATIQSLLLIWLGSRDREWGTRTRVEQRVQVSQTRFRVPDVCVLRRDLPIEQIIHQPPLVCIEVLSPEDTLQRVLAKVDDYRRMGVEHVWVLDPLARKGYVCTLNGLNLPENDTFVVPGTEIHVPLVEIFAGLDEA